MRTVAIVLLMALTITACQKSPPAAGTPQKITVSFTYQPQCTLVHIALAKGYFLDEGLDVQPQMYTFGKAALQSVLDRKADIATAAETPIMFNILKGEDIRVLANIVASNANNGIVARRDAGISVTKDLKGKRVGFTPGTTSDFFLSSLLTAGGMVRTDVQEVALKPEEMLDAVMAKKVDAVSTWNYPLSQIARALGADGIVIYDREVYTETFNLVAQRDFVDKSPLTIQRFLRAVIKAEEFARKNPDEAQSIMAAATKVDKSLIRDVWDAFQFRVGLDQILLIALEDETRWAISNKLTDQTRMPNYLAHIHFDGLKAVRPEAIRIKQ